MADDVKITDPAAALAIAERLATLALAGASESDLLDAMCDGLVAAGVPVRRVLVGVDLLHPKLCAENVVWRHGAGAERTHYLREDLEETDAQWRQSPFYPMSEAGETRFRQRLDGSEDPERFPVFADLRAAGMTDYLAYVSTLGENATIGEMDSVYSSWSTDRAGGFEAADIATLEALLPVFVLAFKSALVDWMGESLMETYLGRDASRRVLRGAIDRGAARSIRAVIWYSDLEGSTRIADTEPRDRLMALLNDYAECVVDAIDAHDGQVLKFMGDGILAIFELDDDPEQACGRALLAAGGALATVADLNARRLAEGLPTTRVNLALHLGDVLYGNIGSQDRLDFTVVGPAVNEASRIEAMCRGLEQDVIVSAAFAAAAGRIGGRLVSLGRYALRGVRQPQELFTLDPEARATGD